MSSIDPMLLLAGKQPRRKKPIRVAVVKQEADATNEEEQAMGVDMADHHNTAAGAAVSRNSDNQDLPQQGYHQTKKDQKPAADDNAKPVHSPTLKHPIKMSKTPFHTSLADRCRQVIVAHLERYPPVVLGVLDPEEWSELIARRHAKTKPARGSGGLDGTGRLTPAVSERVMAAIEEASPHLVTPQTDELIWKDCVNMRFRRGGLTRPRMLEEPWPIMVEQIQTWGDTLLEQGLQTPHSVIQALSTAPMNISLLQSTEIGRNLKKAIKAMKQKLSQEDEDDDPRGCLDKLTRLLNRWKDMVANGGGGSSSAAGGYKTTSQDEEDWNLAESCQSWRELYQGLKQREESRREALGQRMRENRANLNADRPKVVKVRPAKKQHERILHGGGATAAGPIPHTTNLKLQKLRHETAVVAARTNTAAKPAWSSGGGGSSFSRAVAVAACAKRKANMATSSSAVKRMRNAASSPLQHRRPPAARPSSSAPSSSTASGTARSRLVGIVGKNRSPPVRTFNPQK